MAQLIKAEGWDALFTDQGKDGTETYHTLPVLFWLFDDDDHLNGLVDGATKYRKGFNRADSFTNFVRYQEADCGPLEPVSTVPGWWVERLAHGIVDFYEPVIAWLISRDGYSMKAVVEPTSDGCSFPVEAGEDARFVYDPTRGPYQEEVPLAHVHELVNGE